MPWPNLPDAAIAAAIFGQYALVPMVQPTAPSLVEPEGTTIQRGTDLRFLRQLARRNGFDLYVQPEPITGIDQGFFRPRLPVGLPQAVLNVNMGVGDERLRLRGPLRHDAADQRRRGQRSTRRRRRRSRRSRPRRSSRRWGSSRRSPGCCRRPSFARSTPGSCAPATSSSSSQGIADLSSYALVASGEVGRRRRRPPSGRARERARRGPGLQRLLLPHAGHATRSRTTATRSGSRPAATPRR